MKIIFLGTAGFHPNETRHTVSIFIPEIGFLLDAGTGSFRVRKFLQTQHLDIFLSHAHLDHSQGLVYLSDILWNMDVPNENVVIHGKKSHLAYIARHIFGSPGFPLPFSYQLHPISQTFFAQGVKVQTKILTHPGGSVGYRFTFPNRKILAYIVDTATNGEQLQLMKNADLVIHECNFPDALNGLPISAEQWAEKTGHSTTSKVHELAIKARVKQLVLVHFNPLDMREDPTDQAHARIKFQNIIVAQDMMEIEL